MSFPYSHLAPATILGNTLISIETKRAPITCPRTQGYPAAEEVFQLTITPKSWNVIHYPVFQHKIQIIFIYLFYSIYSVSYSIYSIVFIL